MEESNSFAEFVRLHKPQLLASAVPEHFWMTIFQKLKNGIFNSGDSFVLVQRDDVEEDEKSGMTVVMTLEGGLDNHDGQHVYLIDHAWTFQEREAVPQLRSVPGLLHRISNLMGLECEIMSSMSVDTIHEALWKFLRTYSRVINAEDPPVTFWYLLDEFGSCIQHSSEPNFRAVPFFYHGDDSAYTLLFPIKFIPENSEVLIDYVEGVGHHDEKSRNALLVPWTGQSFVLETCTQTEPNEDYFLSGATIEVLPNQVEDMPHNLPSVLKVYSEYRRINEFLTAPGFAIVDSEEDADILWLTRHFFDYKTLHESRPGTFVNQFPCERVITTKDLLSIVARRGRDGYDLPIWLPLTYNLVTELPSFVGVFQRRSSANLDNHWICKPWNLARALNTTVTNNLNCILRLPFSGPKIAQKYAENPVLFLRENVGNVKFDIRYVVLLESVEPLKLYVYKNFFLRFANKPFGLEDLWEYEKHFTVMNYQEDSALHRMMCEDFVPEFEAQYPQLNWGEVEKKLLSMLKELFSRACRAPPPRGLAHFPQSRALYAVDLMLQWTKPRQDADDSQSIQPLLLEVNYGPDCNRACHYYPQFYNDIFNLLFKGILNDSQFHVL